MKSNSFVAYTIDAKLWRVFIACQNKLFVKQNLSGDISCNFYIDILMSRKLNIFSSLIWLFWAPL